MSIRVQLASLLAAGTLFSGAAQGVTVGDIYQAPSVKKMSPGSELNPETMKGKVTVINFWATWCAACKVELKEMETEFAPLLKETKFQFAMVSLDKEPAAALAWIKENLKVVPEMQSLLYEDSGFVAAGVLDVDSFPMTLIVGPDLKVLHVQRGFTEGEKSTAEMTAKVKAKLAAY